MLGWHPALAPCSAAALRYCREQKEPKNVVTFICDSGAKYLSKMFNDFWMTDNGFIDRPKTYGDLRDMIARRHLDREDYTLSAWHSRCNRPSSACVIYGVSQMVVIDEASDRVVQESLMRATF